MDGIEKDLQNRAEVVRLSLLSGIGKEIAKRYEVRRAPATLVLNGNGDVVYRHAGIPSRKTVVAEVAAA